MLCHDFFTVKYVLIVSSEILSLFYVPPFNSVCLSLFFQSTFISYFAFISVFVFILISCEVLSHFIRFFLVFVFICNTMQSTVFFILYGK